MMKHLHGREKLSISLNTSKKDDNICLLVENLGRVTETIGDRKV